MANYSIIINSKFKPFSYAEMLAPVQQSTEAHQQVEEAYSALSTQAESIAAKANEQTDPKAYARYKAYAEQLQAQAAELARNGLTPDSRRNMFRMRDMYARQILPIQEAIQKRKEISDLQYKAQLANPTLLVGKKAATTSLDEFLDNPNIDFSQQYSGAMLTQQVAQQASALANELQSYGKGKPIDPYTYTFLKRYGFTRAEVLKAINDPNASGSSRVLSAIVDSVLTSSGVSQWADQATMERARAYANQGLWSAIGKADVGTLENYGARQALQDQMNARQAARQARAARAASRGSGGSSGATYANNPLFPNSPLNVKPRDIQIRGTGKNKSLGERMLKDLGLTLTKGINGKSITKVNKINTTIIKQTDKIPKSYRSNIVAAFEPQSYGAGTVGTQKYSINANLWKTDARSGRPVIMSRNEFVAQGKTKEEKDGLRYYYNNKVLPSLKKLGANSDLAANRGEYFAGYIGGKGYNYINKTEDRKFQGYAMRFKESNRPDVADAISSLIRESGGQVWELNSDNFKNQERMKGAPISAEDFRNMALSKQDTQNVNSKYAHPMTLYNSLNNGREGLIIDMGDKQYYLPQNKMGAKVAKDGYLGLNAKQTGDINLAEAQLLQQDGIRRYGSWKRAIQEDQRLGGQLRYQIADFYIKSATNQAISQIGDDILGVYNIPDFDIAKQADTDGDTKIGMGY